jgi:hypothetical protein
MAFMVGMFATLMFVQASFRWHDSSAWPFRTEGVADLFGFQLKSAVLADIWCASGMLIVALALYRIGRRIDALTPEPPEHLIWKELA